MDSTAKTSRTALNEEQLCDSSFCIQRFSVPYTSVSVSVSVSVCVCVLLCFVAMPLPVTFVIQRTVKTSLYMTESIINNKSHHPSTFFHPLSFTLFTSTPPRPD